MNETYLMPTQGAGRYFVSKQIQGSVVMLNLLRFRQLADYSATPALMPNEPISGKRAYQLYVDHTLPYLTQYLFETTSIIINVIMILVIVLSAGIIKSSVQSALIKASILVMFVIFFLNIIGNFTSENEFEKNVFTPFTFLLSILCFILTFNKNHSSDR